MADLENGLPASPEAERSILGSILLAPELIKSEAGSISSEDFSLDSHRRIFTRMLDLADEGSPIDVFTVSDILGIRIIPDRWRSA
jgi:replicative DNA helicase